MSLSTSNQKENDVLSAFAGLVVLMVILAILFLLTTPNVIGEVRVAETVVEVTSQVTEVVVAEASNAVSDTNTVSAAYDPALVEQGKQLFTGCAVCHGSDGHGITGLGNDLVTGEFALTTTDTVLVNLIITGRPIWDAANTTMLDMPPKGGNPALTEGDITAIVAYIRGLQTP